MHRVLYKVLLLSGSLLHILVILKLVYIKARETLTGVIIQLFNWFGVEDLW